MKKGGVKFLMCRPDFFGVDYVINPWMEGNLGKTVRGAALEQWDGLYARLREVAEVELIPPEPGLPDMVFTANAGTLAGNVVVLSHFLHRERRGEEPHFQRWFNRRGFEVLELPTSLPSEGAGDALLDRSGGWLWAGYGLRSELDTHPLLAQWLGVEVVSLRLADPRFYHLDTCLCPLEGGWLLYYPAAFDARSNRQIEQRVPADKRIAVSEADAARFACNAINAGPNVLLNQASPELTAKLQGAGFRVIETPMEEFMKAGGAAKCLALRLTEPLPDHARPATSVQSRCVRLEGQLLDSGLLDRALDVVVDGGGSFRNLEFQLGRQRRSPSETEFQVSAPSGEALAAILGQPVDLGAVTSEPQERDARLEPVSHTGVAPEAFYATTIYPTEVRVGGRWLPVQDQRMDAVIVLANQDQHPVARCKLFRELRPGERLVTGAEGIRTRRKAGARDRSARLPAEHEFAFMGASVSSERRVELAIERISWEMRRMGHQHHPPLRRSPPRRRAGRVDQRHLL